MDGSTRSKKIITRSRTNQETTIKARRKISKLICLHSKINKSAFRAAWILYHQNWICFNCHLMGVMVRSGITRRTVIIKIESIRNSRVIIAGLVLRIMHAAHLTEVVATWIMGWWVVLFQRTAILREVAMDVLVGTLLEVVTSRRIIMQTCNWGHRLRK